MDGRGVRDALRGCGGLEEFLGATGAPTKHCECRRQESAEYSTKEMRLKKEIRRPACCEDWMTEFSLQGRAWRESWALGARAN